jgi:hypothetical protein
MFNMMLFFRYKKCIYLCSFISYNGFLKNILYCIDSQTISILGKMTLIFSASFDWTL